MIQLCWLTNKSIDNVREGGAVIRFRLNLITFLSLLPGSDGKDAYLSKEGKKPKKQKENSAKVDFFNSIAAIAPAPCLTCTNR